MGGRITAPISASAVSTRRCPRWSGVSRTTRTSGRPSLRVTSAARAITVSAAQWATAAPDLLVDRLLEVGLVLQHPEDLGAKVAERLVVGGLDHHALGRGQVGHDAVGQREHALAAHAGHRVNPRSLASLVFTIVKRRL